MFQVSLEMFQVFVEILMIAKSKSLTAKLELILKT